LRVNNKVIKDRMNADDWTVSSSDPLEQLKILELLTGSAVNFESKAKFVTKDTYVLINTIHSFRNRIEHPGGEIVNVGVAAAIMLICIELLACLDRELPKGPASG
jgi:hypothetical protein